MKRPALVAAKRFTRMASVRGVISRRKKMNKTKIEWTDYSWNPITGCLHGCWYCYAKRMFHRFGKSFEPTFYPERIEKLRWAVKHSIKYKRPAKIFVCSVSDLFAPWTKEEWRKAVLDEIQKPEYNHLTFQLLTKNPENIPPLAPKKNIWIGTTITCQKEMDKMYSLVNNYRGIKFLSFEPLLEFIMIFKDEIESYFSQIDWVIIGKLTGSKKIKLEKEWVLSLIRECRAHKVPLFLKDNLKWSEKIQEFPTLK